jgi:DNA polymerase III epsilon subunit-like protein
MDLSNLIFLDTETTGNSEEDRLCQLAWKRHSSVSTETFCKLYKPPVRISVESMSVHHITPRMVEDKPQFVNSTDYASVRDLLELPDTVMVAHNAPFDQSMMEKEGIHPTQVIDTLKLVRHFDPMMTMSRHNLQYLRYYLKLDDSIDMEIRAHDALGDVIITELLFDRLYAKTQSQFELVSETDTVHKMIDLSTQPAMIGKFAFGKYKGLSVEEVARQDRGYLEWLYNSKKQSDQDEADWIFTLEKILGRK